MHNLSKRELIEHNFIDHVNSLLNLHPVIAGCLNNSSFANKLARLYFFDLLCFQQDRNPNNYGFLVGNDSTELIHLDDSNILFADDPEAIRCYASDESVLDSWMKHEQRTLLLLEKGENPFERKSAKISRMIRRGLIKKDDLEQAEVLFSQQGIRTAITAIEKKSNCAFPRSFITLLDQAYAGYPALLN